MTKIICLLLAVAVLLSLSGCATHSETMAKLHEAAQSAHSTLAVLPTLAVSCWILALVLWAAAFHVAASGRQEVTRFHAEIEKAEGDLKSRRKDLKAIRQAAFDAAAWRADSEALIAALDPRHKDR